MLQVKEIWTISEYNYKKELFRKFSFGGNKEEMNSWINQKKYAGKNGSCRLEVEKEKPPGKAYQNVSWDPNTTDSRRVGRVSKGNSV